MADEMKEKPEETNGESGDAQEKKKKKKDKKKKANDVDREQEEPPTDDNDKKKKKKKKEKTKKDDNASAEEESRRNNDAAEREQNQDVPLEPETEQSDEKQKKKKKKKKKRNEIEDNTPAEGEDKPQPTEGDREEIQDPEKEKAKDKKKKKKKNKQKEDSQPVEVEEVSNEGKEVKEHSQPASNETEKTKNEKQEVTEKEEKKKDKKKKKKEIENEEMNDNLSNQEDSNEKKNKKKNKEDKDKRDKKKNQKDYKQDKTATQLSMNGSTKSILSEENYQKILLLGKTFARVSILAREHNMKISKTNDRLTKVEEILTQLETTENTYQFIWKIENFKEHFLAARTGKKMAVYCPEVESHHYGYKIGITLCPNGDGVGLNTHMSLFFCILRGKYDDMLPWPFNCSLRFSLMDQRVPKRNKKRENIVGIFTPNVSPANELFLGKPTSSRNKGLGLPRFASLDKIFDNEDKYILDDTIFIKIEIDLNGLETHMDEIIKI